MNSFQAKIGWKKMRKEDIKIIVPFRFVPSWSAIENSEQIAKKFKKLKNTIVATFQTKTGRKRLRKRENKKLSFRSILTRGVIENSKKMAKKFKKLKNTVVAPIQAKIGRKRLRKRENKNFPFVPFLPEAWKKIPKKWQKNSKN